MRMRFLHEPQNAKMWSNFGWDAVKIIEHSTRDVVMQKLVSDDDRTVDGYNYF